MSRFVGDRRVVGIAGLLAAGLAAVVLRTAFWAAAPLLVLLIAYLCRPAGPREVDDFADRSGLATSRASRRFIAHHLTMGRRFRLVMVVAVLVLPPLAGEALGASGGGFSLSSTVVLWACMAGTLLAELSVTRPTGTARAASLVPREPAAYLSRPLLWGPVVAGLLAAAVWGGVAFLSPGPAGSAGSAGGAGPSRADGPTIVAGVAFALLVPLLVSGAQRWILRRPQPLVGPELVAADDAVRAASVRNLAALGSALVLLGLAAGLLQYVEVVDVVAVDWLFGAAAGVSLVLALVSWWSRAWWRPVRRQPFPTTAAASASAVEARA